MLEEYRREYAEFNTAWMRERYLFLSGQKGKLEISPILDRYSDLFRTDSIDGLRQLLNDTPAHFESERAAIRRLLIFAIEQFLENDVKQLTEAISLYEAGATIEWNGRKITFQDASVAIITEREREMRSAIYNKRIALIEASNNLRAERLTKLYDGTRALGYESYRDAYESLHELDYRALAREAEALLARTERVYIARLDEALRRDLGIRIEEAERPDAYYFLHLTEYDDHFPADDLLRVYQETMRGLGVRVEAQRNIAIDSEPRPHKSARAFCMPISIPDEIKLVIRPMGGQSDYQAFLHESGHAQHYGGTSATLLPEFKYTGDYALTETYAFLFNHLIADRAWLARLLDFRDSLDFVRSVMLTRLVTVRRYAAKLIYECELHRGGGLTRASDLYAELQTDATKFRTGGSEFLFDLDDSFYAANYLRAWAFEVSLREYLKTRFDENWWSSRRAGTFLREIWETGDRYSADEMASQIGIGPVTFDMLIDEFNQELKQ